MFRKRTGKLRCREFIIREFLETHLLKIIKAVIELSRMRQSRQKRGAGPRDDFIDGFLRGRGSGPFETGSKLVDVVAEGVASSVLAPIMVPEWSFESFVVNANRLVIILRA